jgi:glucokinase-like ROK family protein
LLADTGSPAGSLKAIGMGVPGPVEFKTGRPVAPPIMPGWNDFPIREVLGEDFGCPVYVDNDVNVMALGEQWAGLGRGVPNFLFVKVGTGIGCGIVCNGELYRGADGSAGDIGHIEIEGHATVCRCGNSGCLESLAAAPAIVRMAHDVAAEGRSKALAERIAECPEIDAHDVAALAARGDFASMEIVKVSGRLVGHVLAGLVNFFNPSLIVLGGGVANVGDVWLAALRQEIYRRSLPLGTRHLVIQRTQLGERAGVVGAAAVAIRQMFMDVGLSHGEAGVPADESRPQFASAVPFRG